MLIDFSHKQDFLSGELTFRNSSNRIVNIGLFCNAILAVAKIFAGIIGHSQALLADGINSTSDVIYYVAIKIVMALAHNPADKEHPYGHKHLESVAALVIGAFVITSAVVVFWNSVDKAFHLFFVSPEENASPAIYVLYIIFGTIAVKSFLYFITKRIGEKYGSILVSALASDHKSDIFSSSSALVGIIFSIAGIKWFDPLAGAIVSIFIFSTGLKIIMESSDSLINVVPDDNLAATIKNIALDCNGIEVVEKIRTHRFGPYIVANITIGVDGDISVAAGDKIADLLEKKLLHLVDGLVEISIHYHPRPRGSNSSCAEKL
jgi:cation diffusion facilitator family transporter